VQRLDSQLTTSGTGPTSLFKKVYKHTFIIAKPAGQKAVPLEDAIQYWSLLFTPPGLAWNTASTPWFDWYIEYLNKKWNKTVNRDMWNMTYEFFQKSKDDETMSWWDESGAWPGVLDDFVIFVKEKREEGGKMDTA
jgi:DCN1-like protein 1/2